MKLKNILFFMGLFLTVVSLTAYADLCESRAFTDRLNGPQEPMQDTFWHKAPFNKNPLPADLEQKGYGPAWTKGINQLSEWIKVRRELKSIKAKPLETHIPYFADQIESHLNFVTQKLGVMSKPQRQILEDLKKEAQTSLLRQEVTYRWWLNFNFQLSKLLSAKDVYFKKYGNIGDLGLRHLISHFPEKTAFPTLLGTVGIIVLNRAINASVYPLGLIHRPQQVDGNIFDPFLFYIHDIQHSVRNIISSNGPQITTSKNHKKMTSLIENLPIEKRKSAELIYFIYIHESPDLLSGLKSREEIAHALARNFHKALHITKDFSIKMAGLGKEYADIKLTSAQNQYIRTHLIEDFMTKIYDPAF